MLLVSRYSPAPCPAPARKCAHRPFPARYLLALARHWPATRTVTAAGYDLFVEEQNMFVDSVLRRDTTAADSLGSLKGRESVVNFDAGYPKSISISPLDSAIDLQSYEKKPKSSIPYGAFNWVKIGWS